LDDRTDTAAQPVSNDRVPDSLADRDPHLCQLIAGSRVGLINGKIPGWRSAASSAQASEIPPAA